MCADTFVDLSSTSNKITLFLRELTIFSSNLSSQMKTLFFNALLFLQGVIFFCEKRTTTAKQKRIEIALSSLLSTPHARTHWRAAARAAATSNNSQMHSTAHCCNSAGGPCYCQERETSGLRVCGFSALGALARWNAKICTHV